VTAWRNVIKPGRLPEAEVFPPPDPQPEAPPAPIRRGFFVEVDAACNIVAVDCPEGLLLGDFWLLVVNMAPVYARAWLAELQRRSTDTGKGAADGGESAD
jgi:hypothetical protein